MLFTGDEETNGIGANMGAKEWLELLGHPEFGLNADGGGGGVLADGTPVGFTLQTAEKTFAGYTLHRPQSRRPFVEAAQGQCDLSLAHALDKIEAYRFTPMMNETTRAYFTARAKMEKGALGNAMRALARQSQRWRRRRLRSRRTRRRSA